MNTKINQCLMLSEQFYAEWYFSTGSVGNSFNIILALLVYAK